MIEAFTTIYIGNPYECVIKNHITNETYGMFKGDEKALKDIVNLLNTYHTENQELKDKIELLEHNEKEYRTILGLPIYKN